MQKTLIAEGVLDERVATDRDSHPRSVEEIRRAVQTLGAQDDSQRLTALAVVLAHAEQAIPLIQQRYRELDDSVARVSRPVPHGSGEPCYEESEQVLCARILGILGDPTSVPTLIAAVDAHGKWDEGMALTSQRKTGNLFSDLDRLVIALGFTRAPEAVPTLVRKLEQLEPGSDLSHYKAISLALWDHASPAAAEPLATLLNRPGFTGHATVQPMFVRPTASATEPARPADRLLTTDADAAANQANLNLAMKELTTAALLYRCGDRNGLAESVLKRYAQDLHGHFARYAAQTLARGVKLRGP